MREVRLIAIAAALGLTGCSDPAGEAPVGMQPGNYEIALAGAMLGMQTKAEADASRCITNSPEHIPTALLRPYLAVNEQCQSAKFERTGNRLTGSAVCPLEDGAGTATVRFEGTVAAEKLDGTLKLDLDIVNADSQEAKAAQLLLKAASIPFSATRTGDCTGGSGPVPGRFSASSSSEESLPEPEPADASDEF